MKKLLATLLTIAGAAALFLSRNSRTARTPRSVAPRDAVLPPEPVPSPAPAPHQSARARVVAIAVSQLGTQDPDKYWADVCPRLEGTTAAWCGGFALWVLREANLTSGKWVMGKGFASKLPQTKLPEPGDVAYFEHLQHHAIVEHILPNGALVTIDGNQPGESVRRRERHRGDATAFFSIQPLVDGRDVLADNVA